MTLVEVTAAQCGVDVDVASHVQPCDLGAGVASLKARRAMPDPAIGVGACATVSS